MIKFNRIVLIFYLFLRLLIYILRNTSQNASSKWSRVQTQVVQ